MASIFTTQDKQQLKEKGISEEQVVEQLSYFKEGYPALQIKYPATIDGDIMQLNDFKQQEYVLKWKEYLKNGKKVVKFVPASGAASRMFKDLFAFLEGESNKPITNTEKEFFKNIHSFAFYDEIDNLCIHIYDKTIDQLLAEDRYKDVVNALLSEKGLSYGNLPKGLLLFHNYPDTKRTPMEEHLIEGAMYAKGSNKKVSVHFTISSTHKALFEKLLNNKKEALEKQMDGYFDVSYSVQKPSTDTIAVDLNNNLFRDNGSLLFRPGGHGALIENLNDLDADIIFIKNIDNVVPDKYKASDVHYKKVLAGILVDVQEKVFNYIDKLESGSYTQENLEEIESFLTNELCTSNFKALESTIDERVNCLLEKLNRPIRVCGMVRNEGEAGGGPFIVKNKDGSYSPQILESSQIDEETAADLADKATHFNPVDIVCAVKDRKGVKYNLHNYVDKNTGFISSKSKDGKPLKALELPGLWNGAMSDWNTLFVEVPINTFNPVKTVNDLLRDEHQ